MRILRTNPRKFLEPFILKQVEIIKVDGLETIKFKPSIIFYGAIMDASQLYTLTNMEAPTNDLSIKIVFTSIKIKVDDRIEYNNNIYVIKSVVKDRYSMTELILKCDFEKEVDNEEPEADIDYSLNGAIYD